MPYVNVQLTPENLTREKKVQLVAAITDALVNILGKKPEHTHIVIQEIAEENWGFAGQLTDDYRRSKQ
jgi:4-oxalocrotonate tautomerase